MSARGRLIDRVAAAPISWGVCEVPGWGVILPRARVLAEMRGLGFRATELGAFGYLGETAGEITRVLTEASLTALGGFVPLVLHAAGHDHDAAARRAAQLIAGAGGTCFVTAAVVDLSWSARITLSTSQWDALGQNLADVDGICRAHGLSQVLHPHVGTLIERVEDIEHVRDHSPTRWCLDTGHLAIGGLDPVHFAADQAKRVGLVHLKDVDLTLAAAVRAGEVSLLDATRAGLFRPLGTGDVDVAGVVETLEAQGYGGWYVLEQDVTIDEDAAGRADPAQDVQTSIEYLRRLDVRLGAPR